jgi:hypothetical protein
MNNSHHTTLKLAIIPLFIAVIVMQVLIDPGVTELHKGEKTAFSGMTNEFILGPALGLQQAVAGALWVRADEFFHEGDYDAILPMVRMVTWLDPHQLDVYITGAWHLSYNFTDANERSDRRYIPAARKLLEEGIENNPNVFDIPFELGWENTDKIKDYVEAEKYFRMATERKGTDQQGHPGAPAPMFTWHQVAHALERQGRVDECIEIWRQCLATSEKKIADIKGKEYDYQLHNVRDSEFHNLELTLKRKFSRYQHEINFIIDQKQTQSVNMQTGEPVPNSSFLAMDAAKDGVPVGTPRRPSLATPWDTAFNAWVKFPEPKVMEPSGQFNVGDGARVTIRLHDDNWHEAQLKEFKFDIDQSQTIMQDQHSVRSGKWGRKIDMTKDPKMYSFSRDHYYLVFDFDPRATSPFIQDRFGWSGEGMTDAKYLWTEPDKKPVNPRLRKVFRISKEQILGRKPVTDADVVSNEEYDRIQKQLAASAKAE